MPSGPVAPSSFSYAIDMALLRLVVGKAGAEMNSLTGNDINETIEQVQKW